MKKRTSKSVSATRKTSSRSGTSARTAATVDTRRETFPGDLAEYMLSVAEMIRKMTPEEFKESLISSGILTKDGELSSDYMK
jgi:hypothetical protein